MASEEVMLDHGDYEDIAEDAEIQETSDATDLEVAQQPNSVFRRALLGGYKPTDVDQYVERSKEALDTLIEENKELKVKIDELREGSITIRTALASSLKFSENISEAAQRETHTILEQAKAATERFEKEIAQSTGNLSQEIEALRAHRDKLTSELNSTLESHIRLLDTIDTNSMSESSVAKANELLELENS